MCNSGSAVAPNTHKIYPSDSIPVTPKTSKKHTKTYPLPKSGKKSNVTTHWIFGVFKNNNINKLKNDKDRHN
jgi:hypothetical protein